MTQRHPKMNAIKKLFAHYTVYHQHGPLMLQYLGILGFFCFPAFYFLRFTKADRPYDDLVFRLVCMMLCGGVLCRSYWPHRLKPLFPVFSYIAIIIGLPLTFIFTSLKNDGGPVGVGNTLMAIFFVILLTDWRNMIVILTFGAAGAVSLYVLTDPSPHLPSDYVARLPLFLLVVVSGTFFKLALERATAEKVRNAYASLAGSIAHEMRNPLGQLKHGMDDMLKALPVPSTTARPQTLPAESVNALYQGLAQGQLAVRRGLQVISMTLDEVNAKPLDASSFAVLSASDVCRKAVQEYGYEDAVERAKVSLTIGRDFAFRGDETAYLFVLFNLIKNALYYTNAFREAHLDITVDGGKVIVRDTGPGISAEALARLFEPFGTSGKAGGTGLGLAYCKRVMLAFGGSISCESVRGQYTVFTMTFPPVSAQEQDDQRRVAVARAREVFQGKRLLLVDDDSSLRMLTRHKLEPLGTTIDEASDGMQAMTMLGKARYDLVVLDLNIPLMDGYAVAQAIRAGAAPLNRDIVIVAHSSESAQLARVKTKNAGMDSFVSKPCDQLPLMQALSHAFKSAAPRAASPLAGRSVLVADDNAYNRKAIAGYLKHVGVRVVEADSGEAAIENLRLMSHCDAILMDINMPGMGGLEAARVIRASTLRCREAPILALTAHSGADIEAAARAAGMSDFITKPVDTQVLYEKLSELTVQRPEQPLLRHSEVLLDVARLANHVRIGILDELLQDYLPQMLRLVDRVEDTVEAEDLQACLDALHSLMGISGEAGAHGLHQFIKSLYIPMIEGRRWPTLADWPAEVRSLAVQTEQALNEFAGRQGLGTPQARSGLA
jgi:two-component system CAI-1 autoinducer sensor kinase/phosphatase CqsS